MNVWEEGVMDKIEIFENALIHHGDFSDRLYIMKFPNEGNADLLKNLSQFAIDKGYTKIVGKIPQQKLNIFLQNGFKMEASVPKFYKGRGTCCFVSKFTNPERAVYNPEPLNQFNQFLDDYIVGENPTFSDEFGFRQLTPDDAPAMVEVFKQVFKTYPFPVHNKGYIVHTMENDVCYFGAFKNGELCSISSAEMDIANKNAEMTDFAVLNSDRGKGLSKTLLIFMEEQMKLKGIKTLYTIARLNSIPMNKTFLGAGYSYAGTLINNTNISGGIESMNVLYKFV